MAADRRRARSNLHMTEDSEKMMLLLKELAVLKEAEADDDGAQPGTVSPSAAARRRKEITREIKRLARSRKNKPTK